jgi:pyruvate/2-oxoglutarate dehydrogenase complex dihydrolipoamide acyltransferase (E2) component
MTSLFAVGRRVLVGSLLAVFVTTAASAASQDPSVAAASDPAFARFNAWLQQRLASPASAVARPADDGVALAQDRRRALV